MVVKIHHLTTKVVIVSNMVKQGATYLGALRKEPLHFPNGREILKVSTLPTRTRQARPCTIRITTLATNRDLGYRMV